MKPTSEALLATVREFVYELHPRLREHDRISLDSSLERDLGLDSLARMELASRIERELEVSVPEQVIVAAETPRDLLRSMTASERQESVSRPAETFEHEGLAEEQAPERARTLVEVLDWHVRAHPERVHVHLIEDDERTTPLTYQGLRRGAERIAAGLAAAGFEPGQAAALMLPTSSEYLESFFGVLLAGGIPVPIYPPTRIAQVEDHIRRHARILDNAGATTLITFAEAKAVARLLGAQVPGLARVVTAAELAAGGAAPPAVQVRPDDIAFIQYTSGSTGQPKGVVLTHANILANIRAMAKAFRTTSHDVFVSWLPLYHDMGLIGAWMGSLYVGFTLVLMSPLSFLARPARWLRAVHAHGATLSGGPNFAYELCLKRLTDEELEGLDLRAWRIAFNGAEPVSAQTLRRFVERFSAYGFDAGAVTAVYGLAEATLGVTFPPLGRGLLVDRIRRTSLAREGRAEPANEDETDVVEVVACGQPLPGYHVRVVDEAGRELPERRQGRLEFKGPSTTSGYYRNPEATRALFHDDWLDSGDLAYIAGGDLYVTGRAKDLIIRAGRNIHPVELEEAIGSLEGIRAGCVAAFGSSDPSAQTERLVVVAETRERDEGVRRDLRDRIAALAVELCGTPPDDVALAPPRTVLKTSSGKIRRSATRELYERGALDKGQQGLWLQLGRLALVGAATQAKRTLRLTGDTLYAAHAWAVTTVIGLAAWAGVVVAPSSDWRWAIMRAAGRLVLKLTGTRVTVAGLEHLPREGACVVVSNHQSYLDGPVLVATLPRAMGYVVKGELARSAFFRPFLTRISVQFVERFDRSRSVEDYHRIARVLHDGMPLGYFPEGTLKRMPGLLPFHLGAFLAAAEAGVPVVPVTLRGTRQILRDGSWFPRRGAIRVTVSPPIASAPREGESTWDVAVRLRDEARARILRHCGEPDLADRYDISPLSNS